MDEKLREEIVGWVKDIAEILVTLGLIILLSRIFLGAHMLLPLVAVTSCSMYHQGGLWNGAGCVGSGDWASWLIRNNLSGETVNTFPLRTGFSMGDMVITTTPDGGGVVLPLFSKTGLGDVVIYSRDKEHPGNEPIIHRVVGIVRVDDWRVEGVYGTLDCLTEEDFTNTYIPNVRNCVSGGRCLYRDYPHSGSFNFYITKGDNNPYSDQCGMNGGIALPITDSQLVARGWVRLPYIGWLKIGLNEIIPL